MPSFNISSTIEQTTLTNTIDQCNRLLQNRFDFKNTNANFTLKDKEIILEALEEFQLKQMHEMLLSQCAKNQIHQKHLETEEKIQGSGKNKQQKINIIEGISKEKGKEIIKTIKESKIKVQTAIEGDQLRVSGKKRDELQSVIQLLKQAYSDSPLQFDNFRD